MNVHVFQFRQVKRVPHRRKIYRLASDHAADSARLEEEAAHAAESRGVEAKLGGAIHQLLDRDRHHDESRPGGRRDVVLHMRGGPAAPLRVVVHAGEIVVHQ